MARLGGLIAMIGMAIAFVIAVGIALVVLDAKQSNDVVSVWLDVSRFFTEPFQGIFDLGRDQRDLQVGINWGIAALVYWMAGMLIARLMRRAHRPAFGRRRRAVTH